MVVKVFDCKVVCSKMVVKVFDDKVVAIRWL